MAVELHYLRTNPFLSGPGSAPYVQVDALRTLPALNRDARGPGLRLGAGRAPGHPGIGTLEFGIVRLFEFRIIELGFLQLRLGGPKFERFK
jgi:hypothetical protein